jgi:hypothetical protein
MLIRMPIAVAPIASLTLVCLVAAQQGVPPGEVTPPGETGRRITEKAPIPNRRTMSAHGSICLARKNAAKPSRLARATGSPVSRRLHQNPQVIGAHTMLQNRDSGLWRWHSLNQSERANAGFDVMYARSRLASRRVGVTGAPMARFAAPIVNTIDHCLNSWRYALSSDRSGS